MLRASTIALTLVLVGCGEPPIQCDAEGKIIINPGASEKLQTEWTTRNLQLSLRRLDKATGYGSEYQTAQGLEKAEGCP